MNETWSGLAADGNLESVDVAATWLGGAARAREPIARRGSPARDSDRTVGMKNCNKINGL